MTQLKHSRKEFAKVSKVMYQNIVNLDVRTIVKLELRRESASLLAKCHV